MAVDMPGGTDDEIDVGNDPSLRLTGAMTVIWWGICDVLQNTDIVSKQTSAARGYSLQVDDSSPDTYAIFVIAESVSITHSSGWPASPLVYGQLHQMAGVFIPSTAVKVYQDGTLGNEKTTGLPASMYDPVNNVIIGARPDVGPGFNGKFESVRIFNRALSAKEIKQDWISRGRSWSAEGLVGSWDFKEAASGTTVSGAGSVKDQSRYKNHGTASTANLTYAESAMGFLHQPVQL